MEQRIRVAEKQTYPGHHTELDLAESIPFRDWFPTCVYSDPAEHLTYLNVVAQKVVRLLESIPQEHHDEVGELVDEMCGLALRYN